MARQTFATHMYLTPLIYIMNGGDIQQSYITKEIHVMENFAKYITSIHLINRGLKKPSLPLSQTSKQEKVLRCVTPIIAPLATTLNPVVEPKKNIYRPQCEARKVL